MATIRPFLQRCARTLPTFLRPPLFLPADSRRLFTPCCIRRRFRARPVLYSCAKEAEKTTSLLHPPASNVLDTDTIYALSSSGGGTARSGVAVIRLSGPRSHALVQSLLRKGVQLPAPRRASVRTLVEPTSGKPLDECIVLLFRGPHSFTGEDVAELHVHGSRGVIRGILRALSFFPESRAAEKGEFTRRAFENGRLSLTQVEGLADLLKAETVSQTTQALRNLGGALEEAATRWRASAIQCLARAEAVLDFGDDVSESEFARVVPDARALEKELRAALKGAARAMSVRDGARVAIVGPVNAGKSTLLNALAGRELAIVSDIAGTTRDVVSVSLELAGRLVDIADTAGMRDAVEADVVEQEGMRRAAAEAARAHIVVLVVDATEVIANGFPEVPPETAADATVLRVANKIDVLPAKGEDYIVAKRRDDANGTLKDFWVSLRTREGVDSLLDALAEAVLEADGDVSEEDALLTRERHREHVTNAAEALAAFASGRDGVAAHALPMDVATEELRIAARELGCVAGEVGAEDVLDVVFREFCIGK